VNPSVRKLVKIVDITVLSANIIAFINVIGKPNC
jgi:hypothetical protein